MRFGVPRRAGQLVPAPPPRLVPAPLRLPPRPALRLVFSALRLPAGPARRLVLGALLALALLTGACASPAPAPTQQVHGVLVEVRNASLQQVGQFTLRTDDGQELAFTPAPDFNAGAAHMMTPGHMREHMALADPVTVTYREQNGQLIALSATD